MPPASAGSSGTTVKVCPAGAGSCDVNRDTSARNGDAQAARAARASGTSANLRLRAILLILFMRTLFRNSGEEPAALPQARRESAIDRTCHKKVGLNSR